MIKPVQHTLYRCFLYALFAICKINLFTILFCSWQIKDIQENDAGKYQCQVLLTVTEKISADVAVSVRIPPIIFDNSTRSVVVSEGQSVKLECYAGGFPAPTVIILKIFIFTRFFQIKFDILLGVMAP